MAGYATCPGLRRALPRDVERQVEHPVGVTPQDIFVLRRVQVEPVDHVDVLPRADRHRPIVASEQPSIGAEHVDDGGEHGHVEAHRVGVKVATDILAGSQFIASVLVDRQSLIAEAVGEIQSARDGHNGPAYMDKNDLHIRIAIQSS